MSVMKGLEQSVRELGRKMPDVFAFSRFLAAAAGLAKQKVGFLSWALGRGGKEKNQDGILEELSRLYCALP